MHTWKDGEVAYCEALVKTLGTPEVPYFSVASYLELQVHEAERSGDPGAPEAAKRLRELHDDWCQRLEKAVEAQAEVSSAISNYRQQKGI